MTEKNEQLEAGLASDLNRELGALVAGTLKAANEYLAGMLLPHQQRVVDEKLELGEKIAKLSSFVSGNPMFRQLEKEEQSRLRRQQDHMICYWNVLNERIEAFTR